MKELKKYKLKASRRAKKHPLLSGVVMVYGPEGKGYSNFSFDECFVDAVGRELPQGLSIASPGYIKVLYLPGRNIWQVFAMYLTEYKGVLLWETSTRPAWTERVLGV